MPVLTGLVRTQHAGKYLGQLCKHWSHKFEASCAADNGSVDLPFGRTEFRASDDVLTIVISLNPGADTVLARDVVARHLNRFAFREAPLTIEWAEA
ncbi:MAG: DUF2218 domain-containing protein [Hyphomonadaceae bacterium]|nr:MAG: hypothetical protein FD160_464 [Caulobacteraceae bacterium]MBT9447211.1 DUF2218 domain-containing protein [Hyphomonadaceae bacterium]TPW08235.1 MAG: hypothetical protein FD124_596 [Alphaproteobacteria bacterium]